MLAERARKRHPCANPLPAGEGPCLPPSGRCAAPSRRTAGKNRALRGFHGAEKHVALYRQGTALCVRNRRLRTGAGASAAPRGLRKTSLRKAPAHRGYGKRAAGSGSALEQRTSLLTHHAAIPPAVRMSSPSKNGRRAEQERPCDFFCLPSSWRCTAFSALCFP